MYSKEINTLVSICIPTYNGEKYLQETLDSIKSQTYKNIEVIISDDASKDKTLHICENFKSLVNFPVYIYNHKPCGIGANWNSCIEKANGEYIKLLFQDDVLENNCLEIMLENLLKHKLQIVVCKRNIIDASSQYITSGSWYHKYKDLQSLGGIDMKDFYILSKKKLRSLDFKVYSRENIVGEPCASLFTKKLFKTIGLFDQQLKQALDYEYWLRVLSKFDIGIINEKLIRFRFHDEQTTNINASQNVSEGKALDHILYGRLLFYIERKNAKYYLKHKFPLLLKITALRYRLFP